VYADQLQLNGLPAKVAWQPTWYLQMSPIPVGAGLLANAVYHSTSLLADTPLSRASPLPHLTGVERKIRVQPHPLCELAREDGLTATGTSQTNAPSNQAGR